MKRSPGWPFRPIIAPLSAVCRRAGLPAPADRLTWAEWLERKAQEWTPRPRAEAPKAGGAKAQRGAQG